MGGIFGLGPLVDSQVFGAAVALAYLIFRKRKSTANKHKLHAIMLLFGGYGLASLTGAAIIGVVALIKLVLDLFADWLASWIWNFLDFVPFLIRLIPLALPYALLIAIPFIVLLEIFPDKWCPNWLKSHFSHREDHHTPKYAFMVTGIVAQVPGVASAFHLGTLIQAVHG